MKITVINLTNIIINVQDIEVVVMWLPRIAGAFSGVLTILSSPHGEDFTGDLLDWTESQSHRYSPWAGSLLQIASA